MAQTLRSIEVELSGELLRVFYPLLQAGVEVEARVGCTIKQLLTEQFGIAADYLTNRITTVFLNHKAVDNVESAVVRDGAILALSGAMPGLVGATMRTGGYYAAMRGNMTYDDQDQSQKAESGRIKLKLFNLLLDELGPRVLLRGIQLNGARFKEFLTVQPIELRWRDCQLDGRPVTADFLKENQDLFNGDTLVKLKVYVGAL